MTMKKILILGGYGLTGKPLARHLLPQTGCQLVLAGRNLAKAGAEAEALNAVFPGGRVSAARVDAANPQELRAALQGVDFLLNVAPTTSVTETVVRAALDAGVDYLDVQLSANKLEILKSHADEVERCGLCFITEAGFHPGLPSALVRYAAQKLDWLERADITCYLNMGVGLPYSEAVDELMEAFQDYQAQVFKNGAWTRPGSYEMRKVQFGGEIGQRLCYSMFFEELRALPEMIPSLQNAGLYISSTHWFVDGVLTPLVMLGLKLAPRRGIRPMGRLLWWGMQNLPKPPHLVLLRLEAEGRKDGTPARVELSVSHPDGYELTAVPVAACLLQVLDGSARRPGLWMMGHLVDPARLLMDMQGMGIEVHDGNA